MRHLWLLLTPLVLLVAIAGGCGDNGSTEGSDDRRPSVEPNVTIVSPVKTVANTNEQTATSFEAQRDLLKDHLDSIGVNIGAVPDDVRRQLLDSCGQLEAFADSGAVEDICSSIDDAIEQDDPGLIEAVVDSLSELEAD